MSKLILAFEKKKKNLENVCEIICEILDSLSQAGFALGKGVRCAVYLKTRTTPCFLPPNGKGIDPARNTKSLGAWEKLEDIDFPGDTCLKSGQREEGSDANIS